MTDLSVVEICAGAGGQSLGLHLAGFEHKLAVELDPTAAATLAANLQRLQPADDASSLVRVGDVADEDVWKPEDYAGKAALLAGGVPCPPFSVAGKQLGSADERDLFAWAVEAASRMQPEAVLLENVRGLNDARFAGYRQAVVDRFADLGYTAFWELLEARDFGVPQLRPRMILVALRPEYVEYFAWPEKSAVTRTVSGVLSNLMAANHWREDYLEKWIKAADRIAPTIVGGSKKHGGADLGPTRAKRAWAELWTDGHGLANSAPGEDWKIEDHPRGPKLTVEMVARIQGWLGDEYRWDFTGRKTSQYRQIGNAFPPPVARAVGSSIADALLKKQKSSAIPAPRRVHDEVYRLLRDRNEPLTAERIQQLLGSSLTIDKIIQRIEAIARDFTVEVQSRGGRPTYRLGDWKAFRGQDDHDRHLAFAEAKIRAKVS
ncbi:DNA cytosine methyltransferase [Amorphoplanes digitatis]|uniref:DNA (cytosine-5-)-methyltransferase n=1 Tax=Actinoplanes digitatis TaxID=1868 RepID=A0A7W7I588_9ACTN|nr:DNA (cytosine-5-)-methyltransferase [Actinoplanes digitatis]MBB4766691.1 DNA (cytosine-5)-methyltransferase 1 [Actinoplanes digitatis]GID96194.1 DNA cytosine methyltransferase [Actinoplanes digitatis]